MSNVSLIFGAKKNEVINYSWCHFVEHPEIKQYLIQRVTPEGCYGLVDSRTNNVIMGSNKPLDRYLK